MDSFSNRLRQALEEKHMSQAELARRSGIGRNSISDYLKGKYEAKQDKVYLLAKALGQSEAWLMGFDDVDAEKLSITAIFNRLSADRQQNVYDYASDQLAAQTHPQKIVQFKVPKPIHYTDVTIYGTVSAGTGEFQADDDQREVVRYPGRVPGHDYALRVNGDSMYPMLEDGQVIFVRHSNGSDVHTGQIIIALLNECAFVKKIDLDEGHVRLISLNPDYKPIEVDEDDDFQIQGTLVL